MDIFWPKIKQAVVLFVVFFNMEIFCSEQQQAVILFEKPSDMAFFCTKTVTDSDSIFYNLGKVNYSDH